MELEQSCVMLLMTSLANCQTFVALAAQSPFSNAVSDESIADVHR